MAGMIGSLAMLLEPNRLGVTVDLAAVPAPAGVPIGDWLCCFPSYAFVLTGPADRSDPRAAPGLAPNHGVLPPTTLVLAEHAFGFDAGLSAKLLMALVAILTLLSIAFYLAEWVRHMNSFGASH